MKKGNVISIISHLILDSYGQLGLISVSSLTGILTRASRLLAHDLTPVFYGSLLYDCDSAAGLK